MAVNCTSELVADILRNCDNPPIAGIETNVIFINSDDIDRTATTYLPADKLVMTNLALKAGKSGVLIEGVKQINVALAELVKKETSQDRFAHGFTGTLLSDIGSAKKNLQAFAEGARVVVVIETKFKGVQQKEAFHVLGYDQGLEISTGNWSTAENDGAWTFELRSTDGYEEPKVPMTLLETDYNTTKVAFDNKFATAQGED